MKTRKTNSTYAPQPIRLALIKALAKSEPPEKPKEIRDKAAGLILRHQPTSGYIGLYVQLGRGKRERICDARQIIDPNSKWTLGKARADARRLKVQHGDGRDFAGERKAERAIPTLSAFLNDTYKPWLLANRRNGEATMMQINNRFQPFAKFRLDQITPARLESWRADRQKKVTAETINRDVAAIRAALGRAVKLEIIPKNPLLGIEQARVDRHKQVVRALTAAEKVKLLDELKARDDKKRQGRGSGNEWRAQRGYQPLPAIGRFADVLTPAVIVSLETGLRRGELFEVEWPSIDFEKKELRVEGTTAKTYETRDIPLNDTAHKTLRDWWLQSGHPSQGYVFTIDGGRLGNLKKSYHRVLVDAGIERVNAKGQKVVWHSLRHTFGTLLGAANVDPTTLMKLMGHANLATTQRYLHSDEVRKRAAVELLQGDAAS